MKKPICFFIARFTQKFPNQSGRYKLMDSSIPNVGDNQARLRVSFSARLIPGLIYTIPALGGALSSLQLMKLMRGLAQNETAGAEALMRGMAESTLPVLGSLYFGVICGIAVISILLIRMATQTKT